jgi:hypothetical protein
MSVTSAPVTLNLLLEASGIDPKDVLVFRHRPYEPALNRVFDRIVAERSDLFDCYQSTHAPRTEASLRAAAFVASFIRYKAGSALFIGLYEVSGMRELSVAECAARRLHRELMSLGMAGFKAADTRDFVTEFDLQRTEWHAEWRERLIISWPGPERAWYRWAHRNEFAVQAIAEESVLTQPIPRWDEIVLSWAELPLLSAGWRAALSQWRGIYLITDQSDGKQYVGSAYGAENIWQRWTEYARTGHGGNKLLRMRDPTNFRFSILQRVSPDLDDASVIAIEGTWKLRLDTRSPTGLSRARGNARICGEQVRLQWDSQVACGRADRSRAGCCRPSTCPWPSMRLSCRGCAHR